MTSFDTTVSGQHTELDQGALDSIRALQQAGQPDLLTRIIDTYLDSAADLIEALRTSSGEGDVEVLGRSAHTLKSSAASLGAMRVSALCSKLEADVRAGQLDDAGDLILEICREHEVSCVALKREREASAG